MEHSLSAFCTCPPAAYDFLKAQVDFYARRHQSYEFVSCRLFPGCLPPKATVGFWMDFRGYHLYFRPAVRYLGTDPRLISFFCHPVHSFPRFDALVQGLNALVNSESPDSDKQIKSPPGDFSKNPPGDSGHVAMLRLIRALGREYGLDIVRIDPDLIRTLTPSASLLRPALRPALLRAVTDPGGWNTWMLTGTSEQLRLRPLTH